MTGLDSEAPRPPDSGVTPHECRSVPSLYEIGVATAVPSQNRPTNRGDRHAECEPGNNSPLATKFATVFGLLEVLSGKSRLKPVREGRKRRPGTRWIARAAPAPRRGIYARDSLNTAPNIFGRALTNGRSVADVESWPERIEAVSVAQVNAAARAVFLENNSVTGLLLPEPSG